MNNVVSTRKINQTEKLTKETPYYATSKTDGMGYVPDSSKDVEKIYKTVNWTKEFPKDKYHDFDLPLSIPSLLSPRDRLKDFVCELSEAKIDVIPDKLKQRFYQLTNTWKNETKYSSSILEMSMHPAYQQIIGMGTKVVPLILGILAREPKHWFWALTAITGEDPIPEEDKGKLQAMTKAWLDWGTRHGYEY